MPKGTLQDEYSHASENIRHYQTTRFSLRRLSSNNALRGFFIVNALFWIATIVWVR